jgi:hypothetical protein
MKILKKLVCKRVVEDYHDPLPFLHRIGDDVSQSSDDTWSNASLNAAEAGEILHTQALRSASHIRRKNSCASSTEEPFRVYVRHGMYDLEESFAACEGGTSADNSSGDKACNAGATRSLDTNEDGFIVQQIQKSLRHRRSSKGERNTRNDCFVKRHDHRGHQIIRRKQSIDSPLTLLDLRRSESSTRSRGWNCEFEEGNNNPHKVDKLAPCSSEWPFPGSVGNAKAVSVCRMAQCSSSMKGVPKQTESFARRMVQERIYKGGTKKKTRFAELWEKQYDLPPLHELEPAPKRILTCIPTDCARKPILKQPAAQKVQYYMPGSEEPTNDESAEPGIDADERTMSTLPNVSTRDLMFFSFDDSSSIGDDSRYSNASVETLALVFDHLLCSSNDQLTSVDWLR